MLEFNLPNLMDTGKEYIVERIVRDPENIFVVGLQYRCVVQHAYLSECSDEINVLFKNTDIDFDGDYPLTDFMDEFRLICRA